MKPKRASSKLEKEKRKSAKSSWENYPRSILGWFLWVFPKILWKPIIVIFVAALAYGFIQVIQERSLKIDEKVRVRVEEEKLRLWNRSNDPSWKSALLNIWYEPNEVPEAIWDEAIKETNSQILIAMASNPWVPLTYLERLIGNDDVRVRIAAVLNRQSRSDAIEKLSLDKDINVRHEVADNPNTPKKLLKMLAGDVEESVRSAVAGNRNTPKETLQALAEDKDGQIRLKLAGNENTPVELL